LNKLLVEVFSWMKVLFFSLAIFIVVSIFVFQPYTVNGSSMEPTFTGTDLDHHEEKGDFVLVSKSSYKLWGKPEFGDIVVIDSRTFKKRTMKDELREHPLVNLFTDNSSRREFKWIKRVIGEEGDTIELKDGKLYLNGTQLEEDYILEEMEGSFEAVIVPEDHVFVLGDNRNHSRDSRVIGAVPNENIIGKVFVRYFPFSKLDLF
jgi:signal peptidase I